MGVPDPGVHTKALLSTSALPVHCMVKKYMGMYWKRVTKHSLKFKQGFLMACISYSTSTKREGNAIVPILSSILFIKCSHPHAHAYSPVACV